MGTVMIGVTAFLEVGQAFVGEIWFDRGSIIALMNGEAMQALLDARGIRVDWWLGSLSTFQSPGESVNPSQPLSTASADAPDANFETLAGHNSARFWMYSQFIFSFRASHRSPTSVWMQNMLT